ncbi:DNA -binding domain-containing protein [Neorhizobium petrolearium]|uniref:DNA -binding domain-containing protein n=1 Tax=Neorhizobium petrolearium TaxID=515361 RepID=UPI003F7D6159
MRERLQLDPDVEDEAPSGPDITPYDEQHFVTYLRLLDASRDGADWQEVARIVLHRDPAAEEARSRRCLESHLARAQWLSGSGYRRILEQAVALAARGGRQA